MKVKRRVATMGAQDPEIHFIHFAAYKGNPPFTVDLRTCPRRIPSYLHWDPETARCLCGDLS